MQGTRLTYMDEFIDQLLTEDRVCDIILPRLTKRHVLEELGELPARVSILDDELNGDDGNAGFVWGVYL